MQSVRRLVLLVLVLVFVSASVAAHAQQTPDPAQTTTSINEGRVTFGVLSYLQYDVELHEQDGYNAFEVTRGYFDVKAKLSDRVRVRFTTDVRPTTDANLEANLTARLEYAYLDAAADTVCMQQLPTLPRQSCAPAWGSGACGSCWRRHGR